MRGEYPEGVKIISSWHTCNKNHHERYNKSDYSNVFFDYKKNENEKHNLWYKYPCTFFGLHKNCVSKCWKINSLYMKVMSTRKDSRHKYHTLGLNVEHGKDL